MNTMKRWTKQTWWCIHARIARSPLKTKDSTKLTLGEITWCSMCDKKFGSRSALNADNNMMHANPIWTWFQVFGPLVFTSSCFWRLLFSSVRSSNSHPDLSLIHHPPTNPLFQITPFLVNNFLSHHLLANGYLRGITKNAWWRLGDILGTTWGQLGDDLGILWQDSGIL